MAIGDLFNWAVDKVTGGDDDKPATVTSKIPTQLQASLPVWFKQLPVEQQNAIWAAALAAVNSGTGNMIPGFVLTMLGGSAPSAPPPGAASRSLMPGMPGPGISGRSEQIGAAANSDWENLVVMAAGAQNAEISQDSWLNKKPEQMEKVYATRQGLARGPQMGGVDAGPTFDQPGQNAPAFNMQGHGGPAHDMQGPGGAAFNMQGHGGPAHGMQGPGGAAFNMQGHGGPAHGMQGPGGAAFNMQGHGGPAHGMQGPGGAAFNMQGHGGPAHAMQGPGGAAFNMQGHGGPAHGMQGPGGAAFNMQGHGGPAYGNPGHGNGGQFHAHPGQHGH